ncbi:MAG TPA: LLM class flavin-dependent oxidoreductase [Nitrososphaera sp.]|jgi:alkanesulfonate monooxygenase SsuD/methylene tetrahydromethanopterin reductase-like flavin-dependent oxidoreductase (luciferase family)|nr:LLM class flavin-dependent oxidoreductase [Nitrososphaera sp.]
MVRFGIQAPHEQINPTDLLNDVIIMERYGIEKCWSSDHYMPWWHTGATSGAAWPWLGAALAKTDRIVVGTGITAPFYVTTLQSWRRSLLHLDTCSLAGSFWGLEEVSL